MKELTEPIGFFHDVLWPNPDECPGPWPLVHSLNIIPGCDLLFIKFIPEIPVFFPPVFSEQLVK
jgi:hypothetical protein